MMPTMRKLLKLPPDATISDVCDAVRMLVDRCESLAQQMVTMDQANSDASGKYSYSLEFHNHQVLRFKRSLLAEAGTLESAAHLRIRVAEELARYIVAEKMLAYNLSPNPDAGTHSDLYRTAPPFIHNYEVWIVKP